LYKNKKKMSIKRKITHRVISLVTNFDLINNNKLYRSIVQYDKINKLIMLVLLILYIDLIYT